MFSKFKASFLLGLLLSGVTAVQAHAAQRIFARYSLLERSISIQSLETYAREGRITEDLKTYRRFFTPEQLQTVREGLLVPLDLDPLTVSQFLYTPIGEWFLQRISEVVHPRSGVAGDRALRSALILGANQPEGLTLLNVLRQYPTAGISVDIQAGLALFEEAQKLVQNTIQVASEIEKASRRASVPVVLDEVALTYRQDGPYSWSKTSFEFSDSTQKRLAFSGQSQRYPVDLYLPEQRLENPLPIAVISHGLNSTQESFDYLAQHLASHGYAVVVPEHTGSSRDQLNSLLSGQENDVISRTEFLDRPLDISFALDELERRSQTIPNLNNQLDFDRVGVIGQSFGGYTSLALGGATLDFARLQSDCVAELESTYNLSLLLQCLALRLEPRDYDLADARVKGVMAINPIGSSLFGPRGMSQINVPTVIVGGSADTVSPLVPEQVLPYRWLKTPNRYFAMVNGGTHFSFIKPEANTTDLPQLEELIGPRPDIAQDYLKTLSLAFLNRHVASTNDTDPLIANLGAYLSRRPLKLSVLSELPDVQTDSFTSRVEQP